MSATTEEIMRILGNATKPMTCSEIIDAGDFDNGPLVGVALHDLSQNRKNPDIIRVTPQADGKFQYRLSAKGGAAAPTPTARVVRPLDEPRKEPQARTPELATAKAKPAAAPAPANDGAYAAVLFDLKRKREQVAADAALEIQRIDAAMLAIEALA